MSTTLPERRCERSDLPVSMCGHCRHGDQRNPVTGDLATGDLGSWFPARYDGHCGNCGGRIREGDTIAPILGENEYACTECLP